MGVGKSTLGRKLASRLSYPFIDLDKYIEQQEQQSISALFEQYGEVRFREIESAALHSCLQQDHYIMATGGGTPCFFDNMEQMQKAGHTIWLNAGFEFIYSRIQQAPVERPLLKNYPLSQRKESLEQLFRKRKPYYQRAQHVLNVEKSAFNAMFTEVLQYLGEIK